MRLLQRIARLGGRLGSARDGCRRGPFRQRSRRLEQARNLRCFGRAIGLHPSESADDILRPAATEGDASAQEPEIGPGGLARERLPQRLVGTLRFEEPAVEGEKLAELAPGLRLGRRDLHQDAELPRGLVHAAQLLERAGAQEARRAPSRESRAQPLDDGKRGSWVALVEERLRLAQLGRVFRVDRRLGPILGGADLLRRGDAVGEIGEAPLVSLRLLVGGSLGEERACLDGASNGAEQVDAREPQPEPADRAARRGSSAIEQGE